MDRQVAGRQDPELAELLAKFVCVRVIQAWDLDLSLYQFDAELTWAAMFLNADKTIYGRYGTRSEHKDTTKHLSMEGFKKALQAALDFHAGYPANKADFAGKTGPAAPWKVPQEIPELKGKPNVKPADGTRGGCIHCHQAGDATAWSLRKQKSPVHDRIVWPYPIPDRLGLSLDPKEAAVVAAVDPGSPAEKAGFKTGDRILKFGGQAALSIADIQWVLHRTEDPCSVEADVDRAGTKVKVVLAVPAGWRRKDEFTWRVMAWGLRHRLMGTQPLETMTADERSKAGAPDKGMALRVKGFPPNYVKERNLEGPKLLKAGDVIVDVDSQNALVTESDLLGYLFQKKAPGSSAQLKVLRAGKVELIALPVP